MVDLVLVFDEDTPIELIRAIRPEVLVKGADYRLDQVVGGDLVQGYWRSRAAGRSPGRAQHHGHHRPGRRRQGTARMILVTGGAGFIGSNVVAALAARGERVVVCDHLGSGDKWRNIAKPEVAEDRGRPAQCLAWLAAKRWLGEGRRPYGRDLRHHRDATATGWSRTMSALSLDLWEFCREQAKPFIYASSAATYGDGSGRLRR